VYAIEALASTGGTLLTIGVFFYTTHRFRWGLRENFLLAAAQGAVYVVGALLAGALTARVPPRAATAVIHFVSAAVALAGVWAVGPRTLAAVVLTYTVLCSLAWPILESLVASGVDSARLAKRLATYNVIWPAVGFMAMAVNGTIIEAWPPGIFVVGAATHAVCGVLAVIDHSRAAPAVPGASPAAHAPHPQPEPQLLRVRTLALWVSRIALPATYAVIYGLMPMMPSLPAVQRLDLKNQTVLTSTWLLTRLLTFAVLAMTAWWHTRPRVMLWAAVLMLVAFLGVTLPPSQIWGAHRSSAALDLAAIIAWQAVLGVALGVIYSGSLYFGMVLSEGSTEHSGYHEALIGVGWVLGPLAGALAQWARPGDAKLGVASVGAVIALSVMAVAGACVLFAQRGDNAAGLDVRPASR
jgi:hypothetical protein